MTSPVLRCDCGRLWSECVYAVQRSGPHRWIYYRCQHCSREWTVQENVADLDEPVSSDELVELHQLLEGDTALVELFKS